MPGDANHSSRIGAAATQRDGANDRQQDRRRRAAMTGAIHIDPIELASAERRCVSPTPIERSGSSPADGFHSSSRRCVTSIRHACARSRRGRRTPRTAGRRARAAPGTAWRRATRAIAARCCRSGSSSGLRSRSEMHAHAARQQQDPDDDQRPQPRGGSTVHPSSSSSVSAAGTRLRRRLSKSFHCDSIESGLARRRCPDPARAPQPPAELPVAADPARRRLTSAL